MAITKGHKDFKQPTPTNFEQAQEILNAKSRNHAPVKIGNNTYLEYSYGDLEDMNGIRLHGTRIITFDGKFNSTTLATGGHYSATTKERLNRYLPDGCHVYQQKGNWFYSTKCMPKPVAFYEMLVINSETGEVLG